jgi:hypothetical protein
MIGGYYGSNETEPSVADHSTLDTFPDGQWTVTLKDVRDEIGNFCTVPIVVTIILGQSRFTNLKGEAICYLEKTLGN